MKIVDTNDPVIIKSHTDTNSRVRVISPRDSDDLHIFIDTEDLYVKYDDNHLANGEIIVRVYEKASDEYYGNIVLEFVGGSAVSTPRLSCYSPLEEFTMTVVLDTEYHDQMKEELVKFFDHIVVK